MEARSLNLSRNGPGPEQLAQGSRFPIPSYPIPFFSSLDQNDPNSVEHLPTPPPSTVSSVSLFLFHAFSCLPVALPLVPLPSSFPKPALLHFASHLSANKRCDSCRFHRLVSSLPGNDAETCSGTEEPVTRAGQKA